MARRKEKEAAAKAGLEAAAAMRKAVGDALITAGKSGVMRGPTEDNDDWWYHEGQAVFWARSAASHAFRAIQKLKPQDSYERAVSAYRAGVAEARR